MLKRKDLTIPFYMDPWFWVKLMVFIIFLLFLVWPFSSIIVNAFKSSKVFPLQHVMTSSVSAL